MISLFLTFCLSTACSVDQHTKAQVPGEQPDSGVPITQQEEVETIAPIPSAAGMWRLTQQQYRNSISAIFEFEYNGPLPVDYDLHGYTQVGSGEVSIAPYDLSLYEAAAWDIATHVVSDQSKRYELMGCEVTLSPLEQAEADTRWNESCLQTWILRFLGEVWRRPITQTELETTRSLFIKVGDATQANLATQAVIAAVLMGPHFLFRTEHGEVDPQDNQRIRLTGYELANRLSFFLHNGPPDEILQQLAMNDSLHNPQILEEQARRLLANDRSQEAMLAFFHEMIDLKKLTSMEKNTELYPEDSPALREAMIEELEQLFLNSAFDGNLRTLLTSDLAYVSPELARLYGLQINETGWHQLPSSQERGGLLGRAGFLALQSTPVRSSPTHRGKFIRTRLLCQNIPPPPEGVVASLEGIDESMSLRQQLEQHMQDPACQGCHILMDPPGFALEHFDALGKWRATDNGHPIDASGTIDGFQLDGAAQLGQVLVDHPRFGYCFTTQLLRYATGRLESSKQQPYITSLAEMLIGENYDFQELIVALVLSDAFLYLSGSLSGDSCEQEGLIRECETDCGTGEETCIDGTWQGCTAPPVAADECSLLDEDCNGQQDVLWQSCQQAVQVGMQNCTDGQWNDCTPLNLAESCDNLDNDQDGLIDESLSIELVTVSFSDLQAQHEYCDPLTTGISGACNAATHRFCYNRGCDFSSGFGLLAIDSSHENASIACLSSSEASVQQAEFTTLQEHHAYCLESDPVSADCNASIHRYCASQGQISGFGPVEHSNGTAYVSCTPTAEVRQVSYTTLSELQPSCYWPEKRHTDACQTAIHQWCSGEGYRSGFGPLENYQNDAWVACIPWPASESE